MNNGDTAIMVTYSNITKRELFSAMAMQGMLANCDSDMVELSPKQFAVLSVQHADALIAELDKEGK